MDLIDEPDEREGQHSLKLLVLAHDHEESSETVFSSKGIDVRQSIVDKSDLTGMDLG